MPTALSRLRITLACVAAWCSLPGCASLPRQRSAVDSVDVVGSNHVDEDDVLEHLATAPSPKFLGLFRGVVYDYEVFDRLTLQRDLARVERYYQSRGYYEAHARAGRVFSKGDGHVRVEILVEEGAVTRVKVVRLDWSKETPSVVRATAGRAVGRRLAVGKPFTEQAFAEAENNVRRSLTENGYATAEVKRDAIVDVVRHTAEVSFTIRPGPYSVFGPVRIEGLGNIPEAPVRRALDITEGTPYSTAELESARQALLELGVFTAVDIEPASDEAIGRPPHVPIVVKVEPAKLRTLKLGGGVEFDSIKTDVHATAGWENDNFLGGLRKYSVTIRPGVVLYPLRTNRWVAPSRLLPEFRSTNEFRQPGFIEARTSAFVRAEANAFPVLLGTNARAGDPIPGYLELRAAAGVDRVFWRLYSRLSHNVQVEDPIAYGGPVDPSLRTVLISYPELVTTLDLSDSRVRPHAGAFLSNTLQVAGGPFGGVATDVNVQPEARFYLPLAKRVTFATRGALGFLFPSNYGWSVRDGETSADPGSRIQDLQTVFFRGFFAGGPNSNRGYPLRGIAPHEFVPSSAFGSPLTAGGCGSSAANNEDCRVPVGGFTRWEASGELRFSVKGPFSMATFCDAADVSTEIWNIRLNRPHLSCGLGVRYDTPVGPIRADIGYRIPGLQVLGPKALTDWEPNTVLGLPIALAIGIGEAF